MKSGKRQLSSGTQVSFTSQTRLARRFQMCTTRMSCFPANGMQTASNQISFKLIILRTSSDPSTKQSIGQQ